MIKSAEYVEFENGFLKEAEAAGCDMPFLKGYLKQADEIVELWKNAFDELAEKSGDPLYRYKMANELIYANMLRSELLKKADAAAVAQPTQPITDQYQSFLGKNVNPSGFGQIQSQLENFLSRHNSGPGMWAGFMRWLTAQLHNNPNLLSSLAVGGGGGGLLGGLLGALTGNTMTGMMLGGLGGAGVSAAMGNHNYSQAIDSSMNPKPEPKPVQEPVNNMVGSVHTETNPAPQPVPQPHATPVTPATPISGAPTPAIKPVLH